MPVNKRGFYSPWGYIEENDYQSSENQFEVELNELFAKAEYDAESKKIKFYNNDGVELSGSSIDTSAFTSAVIESATYDSETKMLIIKFSNGDTVEVNLADLIDENEFGNGLQVSDGIVSLLIDAESEPYLTVSENGLKLSGIDDAIQEEADRASSAETALDEKIDAEIDRAISAETDLQTAIDNEVARATSAETALQEAIDAEKDRAEAAEGVIDGKIEAEKARATQVEEQLGSRIGLLNDKIDAEESIREAADIALGGRIDAEVSRATSAETVLSNRLDNVENNKFDDVDYDSSAKTINFYASGSVVKSLDATPFVKDGMIDNVYVDHETNELVIVWNTEAGKEETRIPLSDIFNPDDYYTKAEVNAIAEEERERAISAETALGERIDDIISGATPIAKLEELIEKLGYKDNETLTLTNEHEVAFGEYNISHTSEDASGQTIFSVGNGTSESEKSNAIEIMKNGDVYLWVEGDFMNINKLLGQLAHEVYDTDSTHNSHFFDGGN